MKTIEEIIAEMPHSEVFSVLDTTSGYWQIKLNEASFKLCTFANFAHELPTRLFYKRETRNNRRWIKTS